MTSLKMFAMQTCSELYKHGHSDMFSSDFKTFFHAQHSNIITDNSYGKKDRSPTPRRRTPRPGRQGCYQVQLEQNFLVSKADAQWKIASENFLASDLPAPVNREYTPEQPAQAQVFAQERLQRKLLGPLLQP